LNSEIYLIPILVVSWLLFIFISYISFLKKKKEKRREEKRREEKRREEKRREKGERNSFLFT